MSAVPTPYNVSYDFSSYQISNPSDPLPGDELDSELAAIELSLDETQARLLEIQNDDGTLRDQTQDWSLTGHCQVTRLTASSRIDTAVLYINGVMVLPKEVAVANEAESVVYDNDASGLDGDTVQEAIDELADEKLDAASVTGADATVVSGTAGVDGNLVEWNADGDAVDSGVATDDVLTVGDLSNIAELDEANAFTEDQTVVKTSGLPGLKFFHDSVSPAPGQALGAFYFDGNDDAGNRDTYATVFAEILDPSSGSEDARLNFRTRVAGAFGDRFSIGAGIWTPNATGGDQGADTVNASEYYADGKRIDLGWRHIETQEVTGSAASAVDFDLPSGYSKFRLTFMNVTNDTATTHLYMRVSDDGGSNFKAGATDYTNSYIYGTGPTTALTAFTQQASVMRLFTQAPSTGNGVAGGTVEILSALDSSARTQVTVHATGNRQGFVIGQQLAGHERSASEANDAIRIFMSSNNIAVGAVFILEGLVAS